MNALRSAAYLAHYERDLGNSMGSETFEGIHQRSPIEVLGFDHVFRSCRVFGTLGLSQYEREIEGICEVVVAVNKAWSVVPEVLANALFYAVDARMKLGRGVAMAGIEGIRPEFVATYGKSALYFTEPLGFVAGFESVQTADSIGRILMGMFITPQEYQFFLDRGCENFEALLRKADVEAFDLSRASVI